MKRAIIAGLVGLLSGGGLLVPQFAHAAAAPLYTGECSAAPVGTATSGPSTDGAQAMVCTDELPTNAVGFDGGAVEAGVTTSNGPTRVCVAGTAVPTPVPVGVYAIADGDDANTLSNSSGYFGVSNYEAGGVGTAGCPSLQDPVGNAGNGGSNSGGYVGVKGVLFLPVPFVACGFTSGPDYGSAGRDGCAIP